MSAQSPKLPRRPKPGGMWRMKSGDLVDGEKPYYYNVDTGETTWELPPEVKRDRENLLSYLGKIELFKVLDWTQLNEVADALRTKEFPEDTTIIQENEEGDTFYLIEDGKVEVYKGDQFVVTLKKGSFFGEQALLTHAKRNATIRTPKNATATCLLMDRAHFEDLLGPLAQLMNAVNSKREALRRQQNSSQKLRKRMIHLERMMNPKLAAELEVQQLADERGISTAAAEEVFRNAEVKRRQSLPAGAKVRCPTHGLWSFLMRLLSDH